MATENTWSERLVNEFAETMRTRRKQLGLSAQDLADLTEKLGHPVSRTAIADFELGRRKGRLMLGDALTIAHVLKMDLLPLFANIGTPDGDSLHITHEANSLEEKGVNDAIGRITNIMKGA